MKSVYRTKPAFKWTAAALLVFLLAAMIPWAGRNAAEAAPGSAGGRVVLDPGFGYRSFWEPLANELYKSSPVTAYLPTRLPDSGSSYYGISSRLTKEGYAIQLYKTDKAPSAASTLPGAASPVRNSRDVLIETSAGAAQSSFPHGDTVLLAKNGWTIYADSSAAFTASRKRQLIQAFSQAAKFATPLSADAKGIVNVSGTGNSAVYSAYWSFDSKTGYKLVSHTSLADFLSVLYSFRPVINLLGQADVVLLPMDSELNWRISSTTVFHPRENKRTTLSSAPLLIDGNPYFPLKDAIAFIKGNMQTVPAENAIYFSESGYYNLLKLHLKTGQVYKGNQKVATIKVRKANGVTLVPLRFLHEQLGLVFSYSSAAKTGKIQHTGWFTNNRALQASGDTLTLSVFGVGNFSYESSRFGSFGSYSYEQSKPPQGYNGRKYAMYRVSIPLLPGDNEFVYRDSITGRVINTIPVGSALTAADISFRYSGNPSYDSLAMALKLTSSDGTSWPAGYAETSSYADLSGAITAGGNGFSSLRLTLRPAHERESKAVSIPVAKDGSFTYRIKPEQGKGTYTATLYNPPESLPFDDFAAIVSFTLVVK
ncbi:hypothetical protein SAMN04487895_11323 [Paenibacillus sophorae]|uniref:Copper amine oxidase N-terminal domain-containing protein n=1 Tax=Paenibacillus sophorae TaxID=1333845 RepID=A0A1H8T3P8_9BACL|nr:hypothetical protein [Paenibacillus sophorae]QWU17072.1 copper amine oxidase N-terminal domain-containing protein [Paenibacillus sophorae]SEO85326.1 hypothetical protein SAMN04487895_11323 [Paenibacillus sophorae]